MRNAERNLESRAKRIARWTRTLTFDPLPDRARGRYAARADEMCGAYLVLHPNPPPMLEEGISTKVEIV
jgi:hypothetical protein